MPPKKRGRGKKQTKFNFSGNEKWRNCDIDQQEAAADQIRPAQPAEPVNIAATAQLEDTLGEVFVPRVRKEDFSPAATSPGIQSTPASRKEDGRGKTTNQKRAEAMAHETAHLTEGLTNKRKTFRPRSPVLKQDLTGFSHRKRPTSTSSQPRPAERRAMEHEKNANEILGAAAEVMNAM